MGRAKSQKNFTVAAKLKQLMADTGLTQSEMAIKVGVSQATLSRWLSGDPPTLANLQHMAAANGVNDSYFLGPIGPGPGPHAHLITLPGEEESLEIKMPKGWSPFSKNTFDIVSEYAKFKSVRLLPRLLERLKSATKERGKKTALARFLGVPLSNVSQYLAGDREPGGETTLKMLYWVEHPECQK